MSKDETIDPEFISKLRFLRKSFEKKAGGPQAPRPSLNLPSEPSLNNKFLRVREGFARIGRGQGHRRSRRWKPIIPSPR